MKPYQHQYQYQYQHQYQNQHQYQQPINTPYVSIVPYCQITGLPLSTGFPKK